MRRRYGSMRQSDVRYIGSTAALSIDTIDSRYRCGIVEYAGRAWRVALRGCCRPMAHLPKITYSAISHASRPPRLLPRINILATKTLPEPLSVLALSEAEHTHVPVIAPRGMPAIAQRQGTSATSCGQPRSIVSLISLPYHGSRAPLGVVAARIHATCWDEKTDVCVRSGKQEPGGMKLI